MQHHAIHDLQGNWQSEVDSGFGALTSGDGIGPDLLRSSNLEAGGGADLNENPAWFRPQHGQPAVGFILETHRWCV